MSCNAFERELKSESLFTHRMVKIFAFSLFLVLCDCFTVMKIPPSDKARWMCMIISLFDRKFETLYASLAAHAPGSNQKD